MRQFEAFSSRILSPDVNSLASANSPPRGEHVNPILKRQTTIQKRHYFKKTTIKAIPDTDHALEHDDVNELLEDFDNTSTNLSPK